MKRVLMLVVLTCLAVLAADNVAVDRQSIVRSPSSPVNGVDAITIPQILSYQGKLTDTLGQPVPNGSYSVAFKLYAVPTGGSSFWGETQSVTTRGGLFSVLLGSVTPIASLPDAGALYLGMEVGGGAELAPRLRIASAAYAYLSARAANADLVQGKDTTGFVRTGQANSVTSAMITNATIAAADLGQMGAASGQVMKWTGSAWAPRNDSVGGSGGVPDSVPGSFAVTTDLRVYGKGRIGPGNSNAGNAAFVAGEGNTASANYASVSGGADNSASGVYSHISGGGENRAAGDYSSVGGGAANYAAGGRSAVVGGSDNEAYGLYAAIGGGLANTAGDAAADTAATVAGGFANLVADKYATVGGGRNNAARDDRSTVGGGDDNEASGSCATISGGRNNTASGQSSVIGGGFANEASGMYSAIPGGIANYASGHNSLAAGTNARARHNGSFVWGDVSGVGSDETIYTTGENQWRVRARGGAWFYSNLEKTTGVRLYANGNSWVSIGSDGGAESVPVDGGALLERLAALPVLEHGPTSDDSGTRSIGPAARDFHAAFGYGPEDGINMADADGVALAAIQALYEQVKADKARIAQLEAELARMKK